MFTGIVKNKAKIISVNNWSFKIKNIFEKKFNIWESIAHDWACMTITEIWDNNYSFFVMEESLKKTNFLNKKPWDYFNVESSLKISDTLDWHFVTWHIDWTWEVTKININNDKSKDIYFKFDKKFKNLIIDKWSIAINWVSLTIVETWEDYLSVSLIPLTQEITNLWLLKIWNLVNLEFDMIWKYINKIYWTPLTSNDKWK